MDYLSKIEEAVKYAVDTNYEIYDRQIKVRKRFSEAKNICIFGTGEFFDDCSEHPGFTFKYVSDNDESKWGMTFKGKLCVPPKELAKIEDLVVLIMVGNYLPISKQLTEIGVENYSCDEIFLNLLDEHYDKQWFMDKKERMIQALNVFEDEESREVYIEVLCNRIAPHLASKTFNEIKIPGEYYNSGVFSLTNKECLVDAGAFDGDSAEAFMKAVNMKFEKIYAFELEENNFKLLKKKMEVYSSEKIELYNAGVYNENKNLTFDGGKDGSHIIEGGRKNAEVVKLDSVLGSKKVTFIKMDVEGSELAALEGGMGIIKEQKPKLVISAYHYLSDLWEIPLYIKEINGEYKIFMRHHAPTVWDTDCYAY
ncbi:FkbM family methyltransferase [Clostridium beijerinckii]|uniref:FkbM family methyltransferase n=1 Tax=Clostridium beijerinckii TaxID=1520 RepID=UPI00047DAC04|nr:FkbM family methyltransferase [Clostridium beijerinckii]